MKTIFCKVSKCPLGKVAFFHYLLGISTLPSRHILQECSCLTEHQEGSSIQDHNCYLHL